MQTNKLNVYIKQKIIGDYAKKWLVKLLFPFRNRFILFNITAVAKKDQVNLNYWYEQPNLGDELSRIVVEYMLSLHGISPNKKVHSRKHLYAIGSIITAGIQDCTIWGSGVLRANLINRIKGRKLDVRAVRGPVTRIILIDLGYKVPEVYGDPAIILPEIYTPSRINKKYKYGIVSQKDQVYSTKEDKGFINRKDVLSINIKTRDYKTFVDQICSCNFIVSSSLHGIILAESYGIPAILHQPTIEPYLKYCDWYYSTNRISFPIIKNLSEIEDCKISSAPDLSELRDKLKKAFPYDLYE